MPASVAIIAAGLWARCANFATVFTGAGVLLKPTDSHYYVRFAQLQLEHFPRFVHFDPWVNFPDGAEIYWPTVHTWWVALHELLTRANPEAGAAWTGVTASAVWLVVSAFVCRRVLGSRIALWTVLGLSLIPAMIESSALGNADHHVHEPYLALMIGLAIVRLAQRAIASGPTLTATRSNERAGASARSDAPGGTLSDGHATASFGAEPPAGALSHGRDTAIPSAGVARIVSSDGIPTHAGAADGVKSGLRSAVLLGALIAGSRLLTTGTVVLLPCAGAALFACVLLDREVCRRLALAALVAGGVASTLTTILALLFGNLFSLELVQLSGFLPLGSIAVFGFVAAVLAWRGGERQFSAVAAVLAIACSAVIARSILVARAQFAGGDPLLKVIIESQPLWRVPWAYRVLLGAAGVLFPVALLGAIVAALRSRRTLSPETGHRPLGGASTGHDDAFLEVPGARRAAALVFATLSAILTAAFATQLRFVQPLAGPLAATLPIGLIALLEPAARNFRRASGVVVALAAVSLVFELVPVPAPDEPTDEALARPTMSWIRDHTPTPPDYAIVAPHDVGHLITLWAQRPNVACPFSQAPWHVRGNARGAAVLGATDDEAAYAAAVATKARYVLMVPFSVILGRDGSRDDATIARRLLDHAGMAEQGRPATAHFRLIHDSNEQRLRTERGPFARVFEVVPGALLEGSAAPGTSVVARLQVSTDSGAQLDYARETTAGPTGRFALRVAYPSTQDRPYSVSIGAEQTKTIVPESAVERGDAVPVSSEPVAAP